MNRLFKSNSLLADQMANFNNGVPDIAAAIAEAVKSGVRPEDITLVGHSAGGMRAANVSDILNKMGIEGVKVINSMGANTRGRAAKNPDILNLIGKQDKLTGLPSQKMPTPTIDDPSTADHSFVVAIANKLFRSKIAEFLGVPVPKTLGFEQYQEPKATKAKPDIVTGTNKLGAPITKKDTSVTASDRAALESLQIKTSMAQQKKLQANTDALNAIAELRQPQVPEANDTQNVRSFLEQAKTQIESVQSKISADPNTAKSEAAKTFLPVLERSLSKLEQKIGFLENAPKMGVGRLGAEARLKTRERIVQTAMEDFASALDYLTSEVAVTDISKGGLNLPDTVSARKVEVLDAEGKPIEMGQAAARKTGGFNKYRQAVEYLDKIEENLTKATKAMYGAASKAVQFANTTYEMLGQAAQANPEGVVGKMFNALEGARRQVEPQGLKSSMIGKANEAGFALPESTTVPVARVLGQPKSIALPAEKVRKPIEEWTVAQIDATLRASRNMTKGQYSEAFKGVSKQEKIAELQGLGEDAYKASDLKAQKKAATAFKSRAKAQRMQIASLLEQGYLDDAQKLYDQQRKDILAMEGTIGGSSMRSQQRELEKTWSLKPSMPAFEASKEEQVIDIQARGSLARGQAIEPQIRTKFTPFDEAEEKLKPIINQLLGRGITLRQAFDKMTKALNVDTVLKIEESYFDKSGAYASFDPGANAVTMDAMDFQDDVGTGQLIEALELMVHELTHAVQTTTDDLMDVPDQVRSEVKERAKQSTDWAMEQTPVEERARLRPRIRAEEEGAYHMGDRAREYALRQREQMKALRASTRRSEIEDSSAQPSVRRKRPTDAYKAELRERTRQAIDKAGEARDAAVKKVTPKLRAPAAAADRSFGYLADIIEGGLSKVTRPLSRFADFIGSGAILLAFGKAVAMTVGIASQIRQADAKIRNLTGGAQNYAQISAQANKAKVSTQQMADAFINMQGALRGTALEQNVPKYAEDTAKVLANSGLDKGNQQALQTGIIQALSKNPDRIYMEEYRAQIAEQIPQINSVLSRLRGESVGELQGSIAAGNVGGRDLMQAIALIAQQSSGTTKALDVQAQLSLETVAQDFASGIVPLEKGTSDLLGAVTSAYQGAEILRGGIVKAFGAMVPAALILGGRALWIAGKQAYLFAVEVSKAKGLIQLSATPMKSGLMAMGSMLAKLALLTAAFVAAGAAVEAFTSNAERNSRTKTLAKDLRELGRKPNEKEKPTERKSSNMFGAVKDTLIGVDQFLGISSKKGVEENNRYYEQYGKTKSGGFMGFIEKLYTKSGSVEVGDTKRDFREGRGEVASAVKESIAQVDMTAMQASKDRENALRQEKTVIDSQIVAYRDSGKSTANLIGRQQKLATEIEQEVNTRTQAVAPLQNQATRIEKSIQTYEEEIKADPSREADLRPVIGTLQADLTALNVAIAAAAKNVDTSRQKMMVAFDSLSLSIKSAARANELDQAQTEGAKRVNTLVRGENAANQNQVFNAQADLGFAKRRQSRNANTLKQLDRGIEEAVNNKLRIQIEQLSGKKFKALSGADLDRVRAIAQRNGLEIEGLDELSQLFNDRDSLRLQNIGDATAVKQGTAALDDAIYNQQMALFNFYRQAGRLIEDLQVQIERNAKELASQTKQIKLSNNMMRIQTALDLAKTEIANKFAGITSDFGQSIAQTMTEWYEAVTAASTLAVENALAQAEYETALQGLQAGQQDQAMNVRRQREDLQENYRQQFGGNVPQMQSSSPMYGSIQTFDQAAQTFDKAANSAAAFSQNVNPALNKLMNLQNYGNQQIRTTPTERSTTGHMFNGGRAARPAIGSPRALGFETALSFAKGGSGSWLARTIGAAEGTRTYTGGKTRAYNSHIDPGNKVKNVGSFSYQHGGTAAGADIAQNARLAAQIPALYLKAKQEGVVVTEKLLLNYLDAYNQSPAAAKEARSGTTFLSGLRSLKGRENDSAAILDLREKMYTSGGQYRIAGLSVRQDQGRRMREIEKTMFAEGKIGWQPAAPTQVSKRQFAPPTRVTPPINPFTPGEKSGGANNPYQGSIELPAAAGGLDYQGGAELNPQAQQQADALRAKRDAQMEQNRAKASMSGEMKLRQIQLKLNRQLQQGVLARQKAIEDLGISQLTNKLDPTGTGVAQPIIDRKTREVASKQQIRGFEDEVSQITQAMSDAADVIRMMGQDPEQNQIYQNLVQQRYNTQLKLEAELKTAEEQRRTEGLRAENELRDAARQSQEEAMNLMADAEAERNKLDLQDPRVGTIRKAGLEGQAESRQMASTYAQAELQKGQKERERLAIQATLDAAAKGEVELTDTEMQSYTDRLEALTKAIEALAIKMGANAPDQRARQEGMKLEQARFENQQFIRSEQLSVIDRTESAMTGDPYRAIGSLNPQRRALAEMRSQLQLQQTLADIDRNAENYSSYPGGVEALKQQMIELSKVDLSNTIKQMDTFRLGLRDTFRGALDGLRDDLANPDVPFEDIIPNFAKTMIDGISKQYMSAASESLSNKAASALPGGDLTAKNSPQARKAGGGVGAPTSIPGAGKGMGSVAGAGQAPTIPTVGGAVATYDVNGQAMTAVSNPVGGAGGIGAAGGSPWGMAAMAGLTIAGGLMGRKKAKQKEKKEEEQNPERYWQTNAQWQPGGRGTTEGNVNQVTGATTSQGIFDPAISASQTLSQSLANLNLSTGQASLNSSMFGEAMHTAHSALLKEQQAKRQNQLNSTTNINVQASNLRSFRGSENVLQASRYGNQSTQNNRLGN